MMYGSFDERRPALGAAFFPVLLLASAAAIASHHDAGKQHRMPAFADVDLNGDGTIVAAELQQFRAARMAERAKAGGKLKRAADATAFESIDLDGDAKVSSSEFAAHQAEMKRKHEKKRRKKQARDDE